MAYNQDKDKLIKYFENKNGKTTFIVSIFSYNGGEPKLALSKSYEKNDGTIGYSNGRISIEDAKFLREKMDEIISSMENYNKLEKIS
jgi:hypothetical protein